MLGSTNRGLTLDRQVTEVDDDRTELALSIVFSDDRAPALLRTGELGGLIDARSTVANTLEQIDQLAGALIFELNKIHSSGQGTAGFTSITADTAVDDPTATLNSDDADLPFTPVNGSFVVHVKQKTTGLTTTTLINIDLDGLNGDDTTLNTLAADLDSVGNISASVVNGKLRITADSSDIEFTFSQDTSGTLAALGINSFFTGKDARDIAVNSVIRTNQSLIAAARNGNPTDNQTALAISSLETMSLNSLGGGTLRGKYESTVNDVATRSAASRTKSDAALAVRTTLEAQREALSGVSLEEESINLIRQQRAFQGAARLISVVDEMIQTVLQIV